jgi:hypothetical protein
VPGPLVAAALILPGQIGMGFGHEDSVSSATD